MSHWPHAPIHKISEKGVYIVTAATYKKLRYFQTAKNLHYLQNSLLEVAKSYGWQLQAWAIFPNHYHFIAESPETAGTLNNCLSQLHVTTAKYVNEQDKTPQRRVWWQYWDTRITYPHSYFARLNYVHQNGVKHGLVSKATDYPWCSAGWFEMTAELPFQKTVASFKIDKVNVIDDF